MEKRQESIEEVRKQIIDISLIISSIVGLLAYFISISRWFASGFRISYIIEFIIIAALIIVTLRREKLSNTIKSLTMILLIFLFSISDAITYGLFSSARIYLILIPFFSVFYFSLRRSIFIYTIFILCFFVIGYLHHKGFLSIPDEYEPQIYILRMYPWVINGIHISIVALIVLFVTHKFLSTYSDFITALNASHKEILKREQNYREIFNSTSEAIFIQEAETGKILDVNDVMLSMYGFENKEEILAADIADLSSNRYPYTKNEVKSMLQKTLQDGAQLFEWQSKKKNGDLFWTEVSLRKTEIGGEGRILAVVRDISKRKSAEEALKQTENLFRTLVEVSPFTLVLADMKGRYIMVNKAFSRDTGFDAEEVIGKTPKEVGITIQVTTPEDIKKVMEQYGRAENFEAHISGKNGKQCEVIFSSLLIQWNNEPVVLSTSINITERKAIEKELEKHRNHLETLVRERTEELAQTNEELSATNEELTSANEILFKQKEELETALEQLHRAQEKLVQSEKMASLGILASGIAHEINNPLNFINSGVNLLESHIREHAPAELTPTLPYFQGIQEGVDRAAAIVRSLSHYSRKSGILSSPCNIHSIIDNCLVILSNQTKGFIEIQKKYTHEKSVMLGDEGKLHQAFLNILTNSIHALEKGGLITIQTRAEINKFYISITDNGYGISNENMPHIFDLFFTTKNPGQGSGLGLSITYDIVREHGGSIQIQSEEGIGTSVHIDFPLK